MLHKPTHTGCPCGHLDDAECIRHKPLVRNPCEVTGYACRRLDALDHRRHPACPYCSAVAA